MAHRRRMVIPMPDIATVIRGLECCVLRDPDDRPRCGECPYDGNCLNRLKHDALALLREIRDVCYPDAIGKDAK